MNILIIGGGLFGCSLALELVKDFDVTLIEKESQLISQASKKNHNRIHYGYHYPRSPKTALQSLHGLDSFLEEYSPAIVNNFLNYYMVAKHNSHISSQEYKYFCDQVNIEYSLEFPEDKFINTNLIEDSFKVKEPIFDWDIIKEIIDKKILNSKINLQLNTPFSSIDYKNYDFIINCSYSGINNINNKVGVDNLNSTLQDVVVPIFEYNNPKIGLTIMDGPFCSVMPKGNTPNTFLLYNVKHSVLSETKENSLELDKNIEDKLKRLIEHSIEYFPFLSEATFVDYWRTYRVLPLSDNDERLSRIITYNSNPNFITIFSGKITTCIEIAKEVKDRIIQRGDKTNTTI